jgi:hypothetical protein
VHIFFKIFPSVSRIYDRVHQKFQFGISLTTCIKWKHYIGFVSICLSDCVCGYFITKITNLFRYIRYRNLHRNLLCKIDFVLFCVGPISSPLYVELKLKFPIYSKSACLQKYNNMKQRSELSHWVGFWGLDRLNEWKFCWHTLQLAPDAEVYRTVILWTLKMEAARPSEISVSLHEPT